VDEFNRPHAAIAANGSLFATTVRFGTTSLVLGTRME
jgi:hypothetical protein